jgi:hypothetical protein
MLRILMGAFLAALFVSPFSPANAKKKAEFKTAQDILAWMELYRSKPEPDRLPEAVHRMKALNLFEDQDNAGLFVGFIGGVLGSNGAKAESLVAQMFPMPPRDQAIIIKAIAFSALPNWKELLGKFAERMPDRKVLIDRYLVKKGKTLINLSLSKGHFVIDALWGYYFATGDFRPVSRIIKALRWTDESSDLNKLTAGSTAKWTLAANAERNRELVEFYRFELTREDVKSDKKVKAALRDVIKAATSYEADGVRKAALAKIEQRKLTGPKVGWGFAAEVGSTSLSIGCVVAGAVGHPEIAVPCVVAGALYSGTVHLLKTPK